MGSSTAHENTNEKLVSSPRLLSKPKSASRSISFPRNSNSTTVIECHGSKSVLLGSGSLMIFTASWTFGKIKRSGSYSAVGTVTTY